MADTFIINLAARYAAVFGAMAIQDKAYRNAVMMREDNDYKVELYPKYDGEVGNVKLEWDGQELEFNNVFIIGESQYFAAPPIVSFTRKKNLITTEISGSDSVVVERWGTAPWGITFTILLIDLDNHQYPSEWIRTVSELFDYNGVIRVNGVQFEEKNIDSVYLEDIDIAPVKDFSDTIQVTLRAQSIKEVFFNLLKPND
ncbi:MAG: hypothetical protein H3C36_02225 [Chitinophagaceae bacterium]|nr:hypothetical protein [Chitinophagaceae bacterium]